MLTQFLTKAINLRELSIKVNAYYYEPGPISNSELSESLENLQTAFNGLKKVRVLKIGHINMEGSQLFIHPSFFLTPPENCKVVRYHCEVSVAWWRKFAAYPFAGLEEIDLHPSAMKFTSRRWLSDADAEDGEYMEDFRVNEVAVTGLKNFRTTSLTPKGLNACIYRNNRGLDWHDPADISKLSF
ncbi:hypothetical protein ABW20_dc0106870 [Dactylellina cionopaga]|nr:hypothetical protein ABW20_dc0106870 [Dactylellina cionopaga]